MDPEPLKNESKVLIYRDGKPEWVSVDLFLKILEELKHG